MPWQSRWGSRGGPGACVVFPWPLSTEIASSLFTPRKDSVGLPGVADGCRALALHYIASRCMLCLIRPRLTLPVLGIYTTYAIGD